MYVIGLHAQDTAEHISCGVYKEWRIMPVSRSWLLHCSLFVQSVITGANRLNSKAGVEGSFEYQWGGGSGGRGWRRQGSCLNSHVNPCFHLSSRKLYDLDFWSSGILSDSGGMV